MYLSHQCTSSPRHMYTCTLLTCIRMWYTCTCTYMYMYVTARLRAAKTRNGEWNANRKKTRLEMLIEACEVRYMYMYIHVHVCYSLSSRRRDSKCSSQCKSMCMLEDVYMCVYVTRRDSECSSECKTKSSMVITRFFSNGSFEKRRQHGADAGLCFPSHPMLVHFKLLCGRYVTYLHRYETQRWVNRSRVQGRAREVNEKWSQLWPSRIPRLRGRKAFCIPTTISCKHVYAHMCTCICWRIHDSRVRFVFRRPFRLSSSRERGVCMYRRR